MKKLGITILMICITTFGVIAGGNPASKIYDELKESEHNVFSMSLSKSMIDFFDMDIDFNGKEKLIKGDFEEGRLLILEKGKSIKEIKGMFQKTGYELIDIEEEDDMDDTEVYLYISRKGKNISEAHFVVDEEEKTILFSIFGDIQVKDKK